MRAGHLGILVSGALALLPLSAAADGYGGPKGAPAACCYSWSGFYIGGQVGRAWSGADWTHLSTVPHFNPVGSNVDSFDMDDWIGGGHIGYNFQAGRLVFGIEGSLNWVQLDDTHVRPGTFSDNAITTKIDRLGTITGRVGWAFDRSLVYVRGGFAASHLSIRATEAPFFDHTFTGSSSTRGWTLGTGFEFALHKNVTVGVAYDYIDLHSKTFSGPDTSNFAITTIAVDPDPIHTVTARLSFKFGDRGHGPLK